nr:MULTISPECIES: GAP family protein [unclassified Mycolicibacterium]
MALVGTVDPLRVGVGAFLLSRPNPARPLAVYFMVGFTLSIVIGEAVLAGGRAVLGTQRTIPWQVEIAVAGILFTIGLVAALSGRLAAMVGKSPASASGESDIDGLPQVPLFDRLPDRIQKALKGESVWLPVTLALCTASPGAHYLAAMAAIFAADAAAGTRLSALIVFNLGEFSAALIPLVCLRVAPVATRAVVDRVNAWVKIHHRLMLTVIMWAAAAVFLAMGISHL